MIFHREETYFCVEAKIRAKTDHQVVLVWKNTWCTGVLYLPNVSKLKKKRLKFEYF